MKHLPQNALVKAIYTALNGKISCPVYDDVPKDATLPYVTFGNGSSEPNGAKLVDLTDTTQELHIFSEYQGRKEVNEIAESIIAKLDNVILDLESNFKMILSEVVQYEAFPEDTQGYRGIITLTTKIQYIGG